MKAGMVLQPWLDPRLEVRPSALHGHGMFAREPLGEGEVALVWGGTLYSAAEIRAGKADPSSVSQLGEDLFLGDPIDAPAGEDYCLNHSCDSNLWMRDAVTLIARRPIVRDEELTIDYALWETNPEWVIEACGCGSPLCRSCVTGTDWRLAHVQRQYGEHFTPLIRRWIEAMGD